MHDSSVQRGTEPTYLRVKNHLVTKFGQAEFASHKAEVLSAGPSQVELAGMTRP